MRLTEEIIELHLFISRVETKTLEEVQAWVEHGESEGS
jgi:hypothetical protein